MNLKRVRSAIAGEGLFQRLENPRNDSMIDLWRSVLDRVILDLTGKNKRDKIEAQGWLKEDNKDFHLVCQLAYVDPDWAYQTIKRMERMLNSDEDVLRSIEVSITTTQGNSLSTVSVTFR